MKLELSNSEIEKRVAEMPLNENMHSIVKMVNLYNLVKDRAGANPSLALKRISTLKAGKTYDYTFAEYISRNTGLFVTVK